MNPTYTKSSYVSPVYSVIRVPIDDIVAQKANPNQMTQKSFNALQVSILNGGYVAPVQIAANSDYDPATAGLPRPSLIDHVDNNDVASNNTEEGMQVADSEIGKYFPKRLIDGAHRSQIIRLGKYYFEHGHNNSEKWAEGKEIPADPGPDMLAYLAWREDFTMPCVFLDVDPTTAMSIEVLMNTARGAHGLEGMKDIVYNLINIAGMSPEWVSKNLFLDMESIKRMQQLSGLKASFDGMIDDADMAWTPERDDSYLRKLQGFMTKEATKFIEVYKKEHENDPEALAKIPSVGSAMDIAMAIGFDQTDMVKQHLDELSSLK